MAWTYTQYFSPTTDPILGTQTFFDVYPTGSVSATSTDTTIEPFTGFLGWTYITIDVTVTRIYLASGSASACTFSPCKSTTTGDDSKTIATTVIAPRVITNAASCTQTSYAYTTSSRGTLEQLYDTMPGIWSQVTDTGASGPALAVSTYVVTLSTNLGGQAVTTTKCDVFLKPDQMRGLTVGPEETFVRECVDPRRYLCPGASKVFGMAPSPTCGTDWIGVYGQGPAGAPKLNQAWGRQGMAPSWLMLGAGLLCLYFFV